MWKNFLITAFRNLVKNKTTSLINIIGLALGISCSLILFVVIKYELSFDTYHKNYDRIYRVADITHEIDKDEFDPGMYYPMARVLRDESPLIEKAAMVKYYDKIIISFESDGEKFKFQEKNVGFAEPQFLEILDFNWIQGNPKKALQEPGQIILTESLAKKYFTDGNPLGKRITLDYQVDGEVVGIIEDPPQNTDFPFQLFYSFSSLKGYDQFYSEDKWNVVASEVQCYVLLKEGVSRNQFKNSVDKIVDKYKGSIRKEAYVQPLSEIHFDTRFDNFNYRVVSKETLSIMGLSALILVLVACINFINLSTAQAVKRTKETGIRKVLGSRKSQLIVYYLSESALITLGALLISSGLAELMIKEIKPLFGINYNINLFTDPQVYLFLLIMFLIVSLVSGLYPSMVMAKYQPVSALKSSYTYRNNQGLIFRRILVTVQFIVAQLLIISSVVILSQMEFFRNRSLGFEKESILIIKNPDLDKGKLEYFKSELSNDSRIRKVSLTFGGPLSGNNLGSSYQLHADDEKKYPVQIKFIDKNYLDLFGLKLLAGINISEHDTLSRILITENLLEHLNLQNPEEAIGKQIYLWGQNREIIGVVNNFHSMSLQEGMEPVILTFYPDWFSETVVKFDHSENIDVQEVISGIKAKWDKTFPEYYLDYEFMSENIDEFYETERRFSKIVNVLTTIAIIISSLGLFGLIAFMVNQKIKEIGIRKSLGASEFQIIKLFLSEFITLLFIGFLVAAPLGFYLMNTWLQDFAYRVSIQPWMFLLALVSSLIVAITTVGFKSWKAALSNPVNALRDE